MGKVEDYSERESVGQCRKGSRYESPAPVVAHFLSVAFVVREPATESSFIVEVRRAILVALWGWRRPKGSHSSY